MKLKFLLAALVTVAAVSCQQKGETAIEVNLTDIPEEYEVDLSRVEGRGGSSVYIDTTKSTTRKFSFKCDSITDNTSFFLVIKKGNYEFYTSSNDIFVQEGYTTTVTGAGIFPSTWTIKSKNPRQDFNNKLYEPSKDLYKQKDELRLAAYKSTSEEERGKIEDQIDEIYDQIADKSFETMMTLPVDNYLMEELSHRIGGINYEGKNFKQYDKVVAIYNNLPDEYKNSKIGKALHHALYGKTPAVGDEINDYDLYDIDGKVHHLADYKGKWLLLDFSSYFCGPCRMFDASVKYFYERGISKDFEIITITADTEGQFAQMVAEEKPNHPLLNDRDGTAGLFALNKIAGTPTFHLVNPDGKIEDIFMGVDLEKIVRLLKAHGFAAPEFKTENGATIITNPDFSDINNTFLIDKVEIYKDSVVLNCTYPFSGGYKVVKETGLFLGGKCISKMTKSNISTDDFTQVPFGEVGHCRLTFEPLPKGIKTVDFIEGDCENCFRVMGLKVTEE